MKYIHHDEFDNAQFFAREAVSVGYEGGGDFDWMVAMDKLRMATGHLSAQQIEWLSKQVDSDDRPFG